jgi:hypothetical protein
MPRRMGACGPRSQQDTGCQEPAGPGNTALVNLSPSPPPESRPYAWAGRQVKHAAIPVAHLAGRRGWLQQQSVGQRWLHVPRKITVAGHLPSRKICSAPADPASRGEIWTLQLPGRGKVECGTEEMEPGFHRLSATCHGVWRTSAREPRCSSGVVVIVGPRTALAATKKSRGPWRGLGFFRCGAAAATNGCSTAERITWR